MKNKTYLLLRALNMNLFVLMTMLNFVISFMSTPCPHGGLCGFSTHEVEFQEYR